MGAIDLIKGLFRPAKPERKPRPMPEALWTVWLEGESLFVQPPEKAVQSVQLRETRGIAIATNDSGPWGADVWFMFYGRDGSLAAAFPQGASGEQGVLDVIMKLPDFDHKAMIAAMGSTSEAAFVVWDNKAAADITPSIAP